MEQHKHKGVERENGSLRLHPVDREHSDPQVRRYHTAAIAVGHRDKPLVRKATLERGFVFNVDNDGYLVIDLTNYIDIQGVRVKFERKIHNGSIKRTVGIQIER